MAARFAIAVAVSREDQGSETVASAFSSSWIKNWRSVVVSGIAINISLLERVLCVASTRQQEMPPARLHSRFCLQLGPHRCNGLAPHSEACSA